MDQDVEAKFNRLCQRYENVTAALVMVRSVEPPTLKAARRAEAGVALAMEELRIARKPDAAALVRLAYVRGMRVVKPKAYMGDEQKSEVLDLVEHLQAELNQQEAIAMSDFISHFRILRSSLLLESMKTSPSVVAQIRKRAHQPYPLGQRVRASVRSVVEMAATAGTLAATPSGSYDKAPHGT